MAKPETLEDFVAIVAKQRFVRLQFRHVAELEPEAVMNMEEHPGVIFCGSKVWETLLQQVPAARGDQFEVPTAMWPWLRKKPEDLDLVRCLDEHGYGTSKPSPSFEAILKQWDELMRVACAYDCGACSADAQGEVTSTPHKPECQHSSCSTVAGNQLMCNDCGYTF